MNSNTDKIGILIVGHGSKLAYNKEVVSTLAQKYAKIKEDYVVESGFMELSEPNIPQQFNKLKNKGVDKIIVSPAFLAHGMHTKVDIPTILGLEAANLDEIPHNHSHGNHHHHHHHHREAKSEPVDFDGEIIYLEPFNSDDKIVDIVEERINKTIEEENLSADDTGIVLIGHGSTLPYGKEVLCEIADKYKARNEDFDVELGFMRIETPTIPEAFEKIQNTGVENIIVMPVFLADGLHTKSDIPTTLGLEQIPLDFNYPPKPKQIDERVSEYL